MSGTDWISHLIPQRIDPGLRSPDDAFVRYLRVWWTDRPVPDATFNATVAGQRLGDGRVERILTGTAAVDGETAAHLAMVLVHRPDANEESHGACEYPSPPDISFPDEGNSVTLRLDEIEDFAEEIGGAIPANTDMTAARIRGLRGPLIPSTLLVRAGMSDAMRETSGDIEAWFLAPIPAGAVLKTHCAGDATGMFLLGRDTPAALLRQRRDAAPIASTPEDRT